MNKREAQQKLVAYKNEKREENYALEHGILDKFVPKYVEKIPLGNGKFKYLYQEDIDRMKEAAKGAANKVKDAATSAYNSTKNAISTATNNVKAGAAKVADKMSDTAAEAKSDIARGAAKTYDRLQSLIAPNAKTLSEQSVRKASQSAREDMAKNKKGYVEPSRPEEMTPIESSARSTAQARAAIKRQQEYDAARAKEADLREKAAKRMGAPTLEEMRQTTAEIRAKQSDRYKKGLETENASKASSLKADMSYYLKQTGAKNPTVKGASDEEMKKAFDAFLNKKLGEDKEFTELLTSFDEADADHIVSPARVRNFSKSVMNKMESLKKQYLPLNDKGEVAIDELSREQKLIYDELDDIYQTAKKDYEDPENYYLIR